MARRSSTSSSKRGRRFFSVGRALAALVVIEVVLNLALPESAMVAYFDRVRQIAVAQESVDIEVLGDSVARTGLWPEVLEPELGDGIDVENYALQGSGPVFSYYLLRDQIEHGVAPKYILYAHSPHTFAGVRYPILVGTFCTWSESFELLSTGEPFEVIFGMFNKISYTLRYREQFEKLMRGDITYFIEDRSTMVGAELFEWEQDHITRQDFTQPMPDRYDMPFTVSELNRRYLKRFIDLAKQHGITILWVTMPLPQQVLDNRNRIGFTRDYGAFVDSITADNVIMLQPDFTVIDNRCFRDHSHMNADGGIAFSETIARKLAPLVSK
jgi:hypothetical protein